MSGLTPQSIRLAKEILSRESGQPEFVFVPDHGVLPINDMRVYEYLRSLRLPE